MAIRATLVGLALSCVSFAGCGTVANLAMVPPADGGKTPFGGIRHDMMWIEARPEREKDHLAAKKILCAADLPFSLVGDVLTWPYTTSYSYINQPIPVPPVLQVSQMPAMGLPQPQQMEEVLPEPKEMGTPKAGY